MIPYGATEFVGACPQRNAYIVPRPYSSPGVIRRISMEGLEFLYVANSRHDPQPSEIDILVPAFSEGVYLKGIPVTEIMDMPVKASTSEGAIKMKRRCVRFGGLTETQRSKLEHFICYHTIPWEMIRESKVSSFNPGWVSIIRKSSPSPSISPLSP